MCVCVSVYLRVRASVHGLCVFGWRLTGPAPVRYAKEAAAVAGCRGACARHRVLAQMVVALEKEVRERHWAATGLSGPMIKTGIYADYRELINQVSKTRPLLFRLNCSWTIFKKR